jgi:hypothetical protein
MLEETAWFRFGLRMTFGDRTISDIRRVVHRSGGHPSGSRRLLAGFTFTYTFAHNKWEG